MATAEHNTIPLISIAPFLDPSSTQEAKDAVVKAVRDACQTYGFFQLSGHGIPVADQREILQCAQRFFDLPYEEKWALRMENALGKCGRGYEKIGGQTLQKDARPDLKEVSVTLLLSLLVYLLLITQLIIHSITSNILRETWVPEIVYLPELAKYTDTSSRASTLAAKSPPRILAQDNSSKAPTNGPPASQQTPSRSPSCATVRNSSTSPPCSCTSWPWACPTGRTFLRTSSLTPWGMFDCCTIPRKRIRTSFNLEVCLPLPVFLQD